MKYNSLQNIWYLLKKGWKYDKSLYGLNIIYIIFNSILPFISIIFPKFILDELTGSRNIKSLIIILFLFVSSLLMLNFITTFLQSKIDPKFTMLRFKFVRNHSEVCMSINFEKTEDTNVLNQVNMASRSVSGNYVGIEGMYRNIFSFINDIITFVGLLSLALYLNYIIMFYLLISSLVIYYINLKIKKNEYDNDKNLTETDRKITYVSNLLNDVTYGKEIRLFGILQWISTKYTTLVNERIFYSKILNKKYLFANLLNIFFLLIREGIVYIYLIIRFITNMITIGDFTMYFNVVNQFTGQIRKILDNCIYIQSQNMYINDYRNFVESVTEEQSKYIELPAMPYTINFQNVSFKYPNSDKIIIKNFSYSFECGKRIALVGYNGAGKTTLIKLLTRLYEPTEGDIYLNGINIKNFDKKKYFNLFSTLFQDYKIFSLNINENIALCENTETDYKSIEKNIDKVGLSDKISSLPKHAETSLFKDLDYEGIELSGGESQRVALARALYKNGNVFIMDEPTASMDPLAENQFYQLLNSMTDMNRTYIFISHRLASTRFCDHILMLQNGEVIEQGNHEELIEKHGAYYELFEMQAENYRDSNVA